jgi:glycerol-3-phosphate O-acyltransferase / dihydroxyacetone phosphate acyltransferase
MARPKRAFRSALLFIFRRIAAIYFRDIEIAGEVPSPSTGGRLFGANHVNALVDPILVLTQAPCEISPIAKSTLWKIPGLRWLLEAADAVPIVRRRDVPGKSAEDNDAVFERVAKHLATGGNILIFPEGTSHNEPHLIALRSGAGRMLERAKSESDALTFQAVALEFDERDVFRSRALVLFGPARRVRDYPTADVITETMRADLSELLVEGATWEERILVVRVAEMFANEERERSPESKTIGVGVRPARRLERINVFGRRIEQARRVLSTSDPETVRELEDRLRGYFDKVTAEEATDEQVARVAHGGSSPIEPARLARAAAMILTLPLAVCALVLYFVPYQLPRFVTRKIGDDPDVSSTYKLGVGLVVYPIWAALLITFAFLRLPTPSAIAATLLALASPFAALPWLDRWDRLSGRLGLMVPSETRRERLEALGRERSLLLEALENARDRADASARPAQT